MSKVQIPRLKSQEGAGILPSLGFAASTHHGRASLHLCHNWGVQRGSAPLQFFYPPIRQRRTPQEEWEIKGVDKTKRIGGENEGDL